MIPVSVDQLIELFPRAREEVLRAIARNADETLSQFGINETLDRLSFFFAQCGHESAGVTQLEEGFNYRNASQLFRYYRTKGQFNTIADAVPFVRNPDALRRRLYGDGPSYYGRGLIQLTNKQNYEDVGAIVGLPLVGDPDLASNPDHVLLVACGYWTMRDINACADDGDYDAASRKINPREPNLASRRTYLDAARRIFSGQRNLTPPNGGRIPSPIPVSGDPSMLVFGASGALVESLQQTLKRLNYPVGAVDGRFGRMTRDAVQAFQTDNNLAVTGEVDSATWAQLQHAPSRPLEAKRTGATAKDLREKHSRIIAGADNVKLSGLAAAILGGLGLIGNVLGGTTQPAAQSAQSATPAPELTAATNQLLAAVKTLNFVPRQFPASLQGAGADVTTAFNNWATTLKLCAQGNCVGAQPGSNQTVDVLTELGRALGPILVQLVPGTLGSSAIITALGIAANVFGNRIITARVDDHRSGQNTDR